MCDDRYSHSLHLKLVAAVSPTGQDEWLNQPVDACLVSLVRALQEGGLDMYAACCGHGHVPGKIDLVDGRTLLILEPLPENGPFQEGSMDLRQKILNDPAYYAAFSLGRQQERQKVMDQLRRERKL